MSFFALLLNALWIVCGGLYMAVGWFVAAIIMAITIVGLPWTRSAFNIGVYTLLPFGQKAVSRAAYGQHDLGTGPLGLLGNLLWLILAGWWLALAHLITGVAMCLTIIGIPLGLANFKLIPVSLTPFGRDIVDLDQARRLGYSPQVVVSAEPSRR